MNEVIYHYDSLIEEGNDPFDDPPSLQDYMNKWDGNLFIDLLQLSEDKNVLEIGVGTGRIARKTVPLCKHFVGIDISPKTVMRAKKNLCLYINIQLLCADFMTYGFSETFDVIYSSLTFMHIQEKRKAILKISDLLNNHGRFILSIDKNSSELIDTGKRKIKIYPDTPAEILDYCKEAGLFTEDVIETEFAYIIAATKNITLT